MIALDEYFPFWSKLSSAEQEALISAARENRLAKAVFYITVQLIAPGY